MFLIFRLQDVKQDFARKAEEVARLTQENIDAEQRMTEINDSHEYVFYNFSAERPVNVVSSSLTFKNVMNF